ncbi:VOC family protein [Actinokineospora sp. G85]|uniref:VOC family protein n=1 Tax=Actinokineospora sp. G85 TaxID=3406626 RepID=UPI003C72922D
MIGTLECTVLDCPDPRRLATFYQALLGGEVDRPDPRWTASDTWTTLHTPTGPVLCFQAVACHRPPRWPDPAHPQQAHLDIFVPALEAAHLEVLALGATALDEGVDTRPWRVYADPAGHPFCLVGPA